jgi:RNA polymerase sigma-70 factor (ECF subfamily)
MRHVLKERVRMGEVRNWEELFERYSPAVFGYLHRMSEDRHLAEDLTSETFYRAMRAVDGFRGDASMKTWLLRIARNLYLNRKRRDERSQSLDDLEGRGVPIAAREPDPETRFIREEENERVRRALRALDEHDRSILLLAAEDELSCREIAVVLEISLSAVKTRLFRARRRLAGLLEKE